MTDYSGILLIEEDDLLGAVIPQNSSLLFSGDAGNFAAAGGSPYVTPGVVTPLDLPTDLPSLMLLNWIEGCSIETSYLVDIVSSINDSEERRLLSPRPTRSIVTRWTGLNRAASYKAFTALLRLGMARMPVPFYTDFTTVGSGGAALKSIVCEGTLRRFFPGARLVIFDLVAGLPENIEYAIVDNAQTAQIVLVGDLTNTYAEGAIVLPLMDCEVSLRQTGAFKTDTLSEFLFTAIEVVGPSAGLPTASGTPTGFEEYDGDPIFAPTPYLPNTGYKMGFVRAGKLANLGRGRSSDTYGSRPKITHGLKYRRFSRAEVWPIIQFFDSRRGNFRRFWFVPPENIWTLTDIDTAYASIQADGNFADLEAFFDYVAVVMNDGTIHIRAIDNTVDNSSTWRIDFDAEIAGLVDTDVARVIPAHRIRFSKSSMKEKWHTDQTCDISLDFIEVLDEDSVTLICLT